MCYMVTVDRKKGRIWNVSINVVLYVGFGMRMEFEECMFHTFSMIWSVDKKIPLWDTSYDDYPHKYICTFSNMKCILFRWFCFNRISSFFLLYLSVTLSTWACNSAATITYNHNMKKSFMNKNVVFSDWKADDKVKLLHETNVSNIDTKKRNCIHSSNKKKILSSTDFLSRLLMYEKMSVNVLKEVSFQFHQDIWSSSMQKHKMIQQIKITATNQQKIVTWNTLHQVSNRNIYLIYRKKSQRKF